MTVQSPSSGTTVDVTMKDILKFLEKDRAAVAGLIGIRYKQSADGAYISLGEDDFVSVPLQQPELHLLLVTEQLHQAGALIIYKFRVLFFFSFLFLIFFILCVGVCIAGTAGDRISSGPTIEEVVQQVASADTKQAHDALRLVTRMVSNGTDLRTHTHTDTRAYMHMHLPLTYTRTLLHTHRHIHSFFRLVSGSLYRPLFCSVCVCLSVRPSPLRAISGAPVHRGHCSVSHSRTARRRQRQRRTRSAACGCTVLCRYVCAMNLSGVCHPFLVLYAFVTVLVYSYIFCVSVCVYVCTEGFKEALWEHVLTRVCRASVRQRAAVRAGMYDNG